MQSLCSILNLFFPNAVDIIEPNLSRKSTHLSHHAEDLCGVREKLTHNTQEFLVKGEVGEKSAQNTLNEGACNCKNDKKTLHKLCTEPTQVEESKGNFQDLKRDLINFRETCDNPIGEVFAREFINLYKAQRQHLDRVYKPVKLVLLSVSRISLPHMNRC